jgi:hypothetical protein
MGQSAKLTRGGNKHRVNISRQKAKLAAAGVKDHAAYDQAAAAAAAAHKAAAEQSQDSKTAAALRNQVKEQIAASLRSIQQQRTQGQTSAASTAVKMAPRPPSKPSLPTTNGTTAGKKTAA